MAQESGFDKYKTAIIAVGGCVLVAIVVCILLGSGLGKQENVVFSAHGVPHCPYCYQIVPPHTDFCETCNRSFRWTNEFVKCPTCDGSGICPICGGVGLCFRYTTTGQSPRAETQPKSYQRCWFCNWDSLSSQPKRAKRAPQFYRKPGKCPTCFGEGTRRFGNGPIEYWDRRK